MYHLHIRSEHATINVQNNKILRVVVDCKWEQSGFSHREVQFYVII